MAKTAGTGKTVKSYHRQHTGAVHEGYEGVLGEINKHNKGVDIY